MTIEFFVTDSLKSLAAAAGIDIPSLSPDRCSLMVGDVITSASSPRLALRVAARWLEIGPRGNSHTWHVQLEQAEHPLLALAARSIPKP